MIKNKLKDFKLDKFFMNVSLIMPVFLSLGFLISNNILLGLVLIISTIFIIRKYKGKHFILYLLIIAS